MSSMREPRPRYDVVIVGGGIYGAAAFWEATSRNLCCALFEKNDFGSGTSANSLKIIHGGIRYLQSMQLRRVRAAAAERTMFLRCAPHLVRPLECVIPAPNRSLYARPALRAALAAYDAMAWPRNPGLDRARHLPRSSIVVSEDFKRLGFGSSRIGMRWFDAQACNSERLNFAFIQSAQRRGGHAFNYMRLEEIAHGRSGVIDGLRISDGLTARDHLIEAEAVIDCTGPWAYRDSSLETMLSDRTVASAYNIVVRKRWAPFAFGLHIPGYDARLFFVTPWRCGSIVGTWYYHTPTAPSTRTVAERAVDQINQALPDAGLRLEDVTLVHSGLLPAKISTDHGEPILEDTDRVMHTADTGGSRGRFVVQGTKYTMARRVASRAVDRVVDYLRRGERRSMTDRTPLDGGEINNLDESIRSMRDQYGDELPPKAVSRLILSYGNNVERVLRGAHGKHAPGALVPGTDDTLRAEIDHALEHESTHRLADLIVRRTDIGSFACPSAETIQYCLERMSDKYAWDPAQCADNLEELSSYYPDWSTPKPSITHTEQKVSST